MTSEMDHLVRQLKETNTRLKEIGKELHALNETLIGRNRHPKITDLESYFEEREDDLK